MNKKYEYGMMNYSPVKICLNASSTPVESKADVSIKAKLLA